MAEDARIDPEILAQVKLAFEEKIPFNRHLGLKVHELGPEQVVLGFRKTPEMVGNFVRGILHGGVISSALDVAGGLVAFLNALTRVSGESAEARLESMTKLGTIDLRVDYLRAGVGEQFVATGRALRAGSRVAVTRMELHNENDRLIATGTGSYILN